MREAFAELDAETLATLTPRRDGPGLLRLAVMVPWTVGSGAWMLSAEGTAAAIAATLCFGAATATWFAPLHECVHRTAFATGWLNTAVLWVAGFFQLSSPNGMRAFHFAHHRHTHTLDSDPELAGVALLAAWPRGAVALLNSSGLPILIGRASWLVFSAIGLWPDALWKQVMPFVAESKRSGVSAHSRVLLLVHLAILAAAALAWPALWRIYAGLAVGHALLSVYLVAEHRGLPEQGDVLERTRSFAGNPVVDFLMWNMPYHAEHHGWPAVPFHALPALHERVRDRIAHKGHRLSGLYLSGGASD